MQLTDLNGKEIEVTNVNHAIMMAKRFMRYRHMDAAYIKADNRLFAYWSDMHEKLLGLKQQADESGKEV